VEGHPIFFSDLAVLGLAKYASLDKVRDKAGDDVPDSSHSIAPQI